MRNKNLFCGYKLLNITIMKKHLLLSLSLLLSAASMLAQSSTGYIPLVVEGMTWSGDMKIRHSNIAENWETYSYTIELKGDTSINSQTYKKCYYHFFNQRVYDNSTLRGFLREDLSSQQVHYLANKDYSPKIRFDEYENPSYKLNDEILLYDFADIKNPLQYWVANGGEDCLDWVVSTREITLDDGVSRPFHNLGHCYIIQGVGVKATSLTGNDLINVMNIHNDNMPLQSIPFIFSQKDADGKIIFEVLGGNLNYTPVAIEGNKWICGKVDVNSNGITHTPYCYVIKGDKDFNGKIYKCCYKLIDNDTVINESKLHALLRDDCQEHKTYVVYPGSSTEMTLYDFHNPLNPEMLSHFGYTGTPTGDVKIEESCYHEGSNSHYAKQYLLKLSAIDYNLHYIEGIGFDGSQKCDLFNAPKTDTPEAEHSYVQFYKLVNADGKVMYTSTASDPTINTSEYVPLVKEGVRWECEIVRRTVPEDFEPTYYFPYDIVISGDSIINGKEYKKCHYLFEGYNSTPCDSTMIALLREDIDTKRVYLILSSGYKFPIPYALPDYETPDVVNLAYDKETLLYDFADISDSNQYWGYLTNYTAADTIIDNANRKMYLNNNQSEKPFGIMEGIGNMGNKNVTGDLLFPRPMSNNIPSAPARYIDPVFLNYYNENGELVYSSGRSANVESIAVNSDGTIISIGTGVISTSQEALIEVVDLNGRKVASTRGTSLSTPALPAGIYIVSATTATTTQTAKVIVK